MKNDVIIYVNCQGDLLVKNATSYYICNYLNKEMVSVWLVRSDWFCERFVCAGAEGVLFFFQYVYLKKSSELRLSFQI